MSRTLRLEVSLISGRTVSLQTHGDETLESLRERAQKALGVCKGRLFNSTGSVLDGGGPLKKSRLKYDEPLTLRGSIYVAESRLFLRSWEMAPL